MSEPPKTIQIGGAEWTIEQHAPGSLFEKSGRDLLGQCQYEKASINLRESMPPARMAQVLWHEIIHAVADNLGIELPENKVAGLAAGTFEVLRANPGLAEYLLSAGRLHFSPVRDPSVSAQVMAEQVRDSLVQAARQNIGGGI